MGVPIARELYEKLKSIYNKGYTDGQKALYEHLELCKEEQALEPIGNSEELGTSKKTLAIPDNATNGDMIQAMFPNARVCNIYPVKDDEVYYVSVDNAKGCTIEMRVIKSWWNAPYKESEA